MKAQYPSTQADHDQIRTDIVQMTMHEIDAWEMKWKLTA